MVWPQVIAAIAAAALGGYNQYKTAKKQDQIAAQGIAEQSRLQREANARMDQQLQELQASTPDEEFRSRSGQIRDQLRRKRGIALAGIQNTGGSDAVNDAVAGAVPVATGYGDDINRWLSGMAAPQLQRQGEAFERADTGSDLNVIGRNSAQEANLTRLRQASVRPNPWLEMLAAGLSAYGTSGFGAGKTMAGSGQPLAHLGNQTAQQSYSGSRPLANAPATLLNPYTSNRGNPFGVGSIFGNGIIGG